MNVSKMIFGKYDEKMFIKLLLKIFLIIVEIHFYTCFIFYLSSIRNYSHATFLYNNIEGIKD